MDIKGIERKAEENSLKTGCHGWDHTQRVRELVLKIGLEEKADLEILEIAALLHDIARKKEKNGLCHAEEGARIAGEILKDHPKKEGIVHCIESHRFSRGKQPKTLEAKILQDADKLDSMGAVGIARCFMYQSEHKGNIHTAKEHFQEKLLKLGSLMHTKTGKKLASERHEFLEEFLDRLEKEEKGEL